MNRDRNRDVSRIRQPSAGPPLVNAGEYLSKEPPESDPIVGRLFDRGDKVVLIGQSKTKKSFLSLQLALSLAAGRETWMGFQIPKGRKVTILQYEIKPEHYHRRVQMVGQAMGITPSDLGNRLQIANLRGHKPGSNESPSDILPASVRQESKGADMFLFDPFYKILAQYGAEENSATDVGQVMACFDQLAEETGAATVIVHHSAKGQIGDRQTIDRAAGSGTIARDFDCGLFIGPHATEEDTIVIEPICRNYVSPKPVVARWDNGCFQLDSSVKPEVKSSITERRSPPVEQLADNAIEQIKHDEQVKVGEFQTRLKDKLHVGINRVRDVTTHLVNEGRLQRFRPQGEKQEYFRRTVEQSGASCTSG